MALQIVGALGGRDRVEPGFLGDGAVTRARLDRRRHTQSADDDPESHDGMDLDPHGAESYSPKTLCTTAFARLVTRR